MQAQGDFCLASVGHGSIQDKDPFRLQMFRQSGWHMVLFQGLRRTESNLLSSEACHTSASSISKKSWKVNSSFFHFALILDLILPLRSDCSSLTSSRKMTSTASHPPSTTQATLIPQISVMSTPYNTKTLTTTEATLIPAPLVPSAMSRDTQLASPASCSTGRSQVGKEPSTARPLGRQDTDTKCLTATVSNQARSDTKESSGWSWFPFAHASPPEYSAKEQRAQLKELFEGSQYPLSDYQLDVLSHKQVAGLLCANYEGHGRGRTDTGADGMNNTLFMSILPMAVSTAWYLGSKAATSIFG